MAMEGIFLLSVATRRDALVARNNVSDEISRRLVVGADVHSGNEEGCALDRKGVLAPSGAS